MATSSPTSSGPGGARLNGWKEIAAHFGKGVRTVQRWEKELGLPVRRLGGARGEIVFAWVAELEAWWTAAGKRDLASRPGEDEGEELQEAPAPAVTSDSPAAASLPPSTNQTEAPTVFTPRQIPVRWLMVLGVLVLAGGLVSWWAFWGRPRQPYQALIENHALRVYDQDGGVLWEKRFEFPLVMGPGIQAIRAQRPSTAIEDLDGDGAREVLFITNVESYERPGGLFCFESDGTLRFRYAPRFQGISFGGIPATGPWHPIAMTVVNEGRAETTIWLSNCDRDQFWCVVEKLDTRGKSLGQFWVPGNVVSLTPGAYAGRQVMFVGGANNEHNGASVAIVDRANPTGAAPALLPKFQCSGCPAGAPIEFLVFPATEIEQRQDNNAGISILRQGDNGELWVGVVHTMWFGQFAIDSRVMTGTTYYTFNADLRPLSGEHQPDFRVLRDEAHRLGVFDHPFGAAEASNVWPVLRWNGTGFDELRLPAAGERQP